MVRDNRGDGRRALLIQGEKCKWGLEMGNGVMVKRAGDRDG